jgi:hypothetical protein
MAELVELRMSAETRLGRLGRLVNGDRERMGRND